MFNVSGALPALPEVTLISQGVIDAITLRDTAEHKLSLAQRAAEIAQTKVVDILIADGFTAADLIAPKGDDREVLITRGTVTATKAAFHADAINVATAMVDAKCRADDEVGPDGLKWSKKEKQYHLRVARMPKEDLAKMSAEQKQKRTKLRQEIGPYMGALRRDLAAREDKERARQGAGDGESTQRAPNAKRTWHEQCHDFLANKIKQYKAKDEAPGTAKQLAALEECLKAFK